MPLHSIPSSPLQLKLLLVALLCGVVSGLRAQMKQEAELNWEDFLSEYCPADEEGLDVQEREWLERRAQRPLHLNRAARGRLRGRPCRRAAGEG